MHGLMSDADVIQRVFDHIDNNTTDLADRVWREPVTSYLSDKNFADELELFRRLPTVFCPSAALPETGSYVARTAAGVPIVAVRGDDGRVRAFYNACRHRGMMVAEGMGKVGAFVCRYHAWAYGLDGRLKNVPGDQGFPDLNRDAHNLISVRADERGGLVFVTQKEPLSEGAMAAIPDLLGPDQELFDFVQMHDPANWKLVVESAMEGYHIKALHPKSFYPYGFDNLNVVETYGPNSRIVFPFRRVEKLRDIAPEDRRPDGMLTYVYHLFPNARVSMLSSHHQLIIIEPEAPDRVRWDFFRLTPPARDGKPVDKAGISKDADFVKETGLVEDREAACSIQAGLATAANTHFTFGRYEKSAVHFHEHLDANLAQLRQGAFEDSRSER